MGSRILYRRQEKVSMLSGCMCGPQTDQLTCLSVLPKDHCFRTLHINVTHPDLALPENEVSGFCALAVIMNRMQTSSFCFKCNKLIRTLVFLKFRKIPFGQKLIMKLDQTLATQRIS